MAQNTLKVGSKLMVSVGNKSYPVTLRQGYYLTTPGGQVVPEWGSGTKVLGNNVTKATATVRNLTMKGKPVRNNTRRNNGPPSPNDVRKASNIMREILTRYNDNEGGYRVSLENAIKYSNERFGNKKMNTYFRKEYSYLDPDGSVFAGY